MVDRRDVLAAGGLIVLSLALFGPHLVGLSTFVGDSDRLHIFLNMRLLEVDSWQALGRVPAASDVMPLGTPTGGLHWMFLGFDPVGWLVARFPARDTFRVSGYVTAAHVAAGALAAYLLLRDIIRSAFPAAVGAALYACSAFIAHGVSQLDPIFAVLILQPLGLLALRKTQPGRAARGFLGVAAVIGGLIAFTFVQEVAYTLLFFGIYACFRCAVTRDWRPLAVVSAGGLVGTLLAAPRLGTVLEDLREVSRTSSIQSTCTCEVLRWLDDGIFGRFPREAIELGNQINLHEGMHLYTSTFAAAAVILLLLRPRRGPTFLIGIGFLLMLVLLGGTLGGGASVLASAAVAAALVLWMVARPVIVRRFELTPGRLGADPDLGFLLMTVLMVFAIVLSGGLRYLVYLAFFRIDFTHARIAVLALLPICALAAVAVDELFAGLAAVWAPGRRRHLIALASGAAIAIGLVLLLDASVPATSTLLFGTADHLDVRGAYVMAPREVSRIVVTSLVLLTVVGLHGLARSGWRAGHPYTRSALRLVPAYSVGCLMVAQAFGSSYFQLNGEQTQTYPVPFVGTNNFTAPVDALIPPSPAARQAVHERLETSAYRSIVVSGTDGYPTYQSPSERGYASFVGTFWQLRLVNGYPVLNRRVAALPWPESTRTLRSVSFTDANVLPWPLLALMNVKYAVVASPSLIFNQPAKPEPGRTEAGPGDLTIVQNPLPVVPRAFFAAAVTPRAPLAPPSSPTTLTAPAVVRATALADGDVALAWTGEIADAWYEVYRRRLSPAPEASRSLIATTARGTDGYFDSGWSRARRTHTSSARAMGAAAASSRRRSTRRWPSIP